MDIKTMTVLIVVTATSDCKLDNVDTIQPTHINVENPEYCDQMAQVLDNIRGQSAFCIEVPLKENKS